MGQFTNFAKLNIPNNSDLKVHVHVQQLLGYTVHVHIYMYTMYIILRNKKLFFHMKKSTKIHVYVRLLNDNDITWAKGVQWNP